MAFCVSSFRTGHLYGSFSARLTRRRAWMRLPIRRNSHCESTLEFENYVGGRTRHVKTGRTSRCDNQLFVKPTEAGRAKIGVPLEAPPFPGANNWFLLADLDDPKFLADLIRTTADALPVPKAKTKKTRGAKSRSRGGKNKDAATRS